MIVILYHLPLSPSKIPRLHLFVLLFVCKSSWLLCQFSIPVGMSPSLLSKTKLRYPNPFRNPYIIPHLNRLSCLVGWVWRVSDCCWVAISLTISPNSEIVSFLVASVAQRRFERGLVQWDGCWLKWQWGWLLGQLCENLQGHWTAVEVTMVNPTIALEVSLFLSVSCCFLCPMSILVLKLRWSEGGNV